MWIGGLRSGLIATGRQGSLGEATSKSAFTTRKYDHGRLTADKQTLNAIFRDQTLIRSWSTSRATACETITWQSSRLANSRSGLARFTAGPMTVKSSRCGAPAELLCGRESVPAGCPTVLPGRGWKDRQHGIADELEHLVAMRLDDLTSRLPGGAALPSQGGAPDWNAGLNDLLAEGGEAPRQWGASSTSQRGISSIRSIRPTS